MREKRMINGMWNQREWKERKTKYIAYVCVCVQLTK